MREGLFIERIPFWDQKMKVSLLIPTLSEIEGMEAIMPRINREWVDQILAVDGGSVDGTYEYAKGHGYHTIRQRVSGLANAYYEGLEVATGDTIITFSPDGNSLPEIIPGLITKMKEGYDRVIASPYLNGTKSEDDNVVTAFGNWLFTKLINILFGGHYTDSLVKLRAWRKNILECIRIHPGRAGIEPLLSIECAKANLKVGEIPGHEPPRIAGLRKMSPLGNGFAVLVLIIKELWAPSVLRQKQVVLEASKI